MKQVIKQFGGKSDSISKSPDDQPIYVSRRFIRTRFHNEAPDCPGRPWGNLELESLRFMEDTMTYFGSVSYRKPEIVPDKQADLPSVLQRLCKLERAGFDHLGFGAQRKLNHVMDMAVDILFHLRIKSDDRSGFDADCVYWALHIKSELATRAVVSFFEQLAKPQQRTMKMLAEVGLEYLSEPDPVKPELLAELGAASHGRMRSRIRQALKNIGRQDLLAGMGGGGPPIAELEPMPGEAETGPEPAA